MDNREEKNKFWKGVLVGALVMTFAGLIIVGVSSGIFLIGRAVIDNRAQVEQVQGDGTDGENKELNLEFISSKMKYIQGIIDQYFLFDEDTRKGGRRHLYWPDVWPGRSIFRVLQCGAVSVPDGEHKW